jgi:hypothetical protein
VYVPPKGKGKQGTNKGAVELQKMDVVDAATGKPKPNGMSDDEAHAAGIVWKRKPSGRKYKFKNPGLLTLPDYFAELKAEFQEKLNDEKAVKEAVDVQIVMALLGDAAPVDVAGKLADMDSQYVPSENSQDLPTIICDGLWYFTMSADTAAADSADSKMTERLAALPAEVMSQRLSDLSNAVADTEVVSLAMLKQRNLIKEDFETVNDDGAAAAEDGAAAGDGGGGA